MNSPRHVRSPLPVSPHRSTHGTKGSKLNDFVPVACGTLTLDGIKEGAYMLCKHADDLLGHHARQAFREKAASRRGTNGIYYHLKDLMVRFGSKDKKKKLGHHDNETDRLVLRESNLRQLIASDPVYAHAVPEDRVDALYHRLEVEAGDGVRHRAFVEFCLLDSTQLRLLLLKYCQRLRKQKLTEMEVSDVFNRLVRPGESAIDPDLFHSALSYELDVVLTTGEITTLLRFMDYDLDGVVKLGDFDELLHDDKFSEEVAQATDDSSIVDVKLSFNSGDEATLSRDGYLQLFPSIRKLSNTAELSIWTKSADRWQGKAAITNIKYSSSSRDSKLVSKGYTCLGHDMSRGGTFGWHTYIWLSYAPPKMANVNEVVELAITSGDLKDKHDSKLWMPPCRGFKLIRGNLKANSSKNGICLWLRRHHTLSNEDLVDAPEEVSVSKTVLSSGGQAHLDDLEQHIRTALRRNCAVDQDGSLNFSLLFDDMDVKKKRGLSKQRVIAGLEQYGVKMDKKDFHSVWHRMNPKGAKKVDVASFCHFLELTDSEIDDVIKTLQRTMVTRSSHFAISYRSLFQSYNTLGDGKLSRVDFQNILASNHIAFTSSELTRIMSRFDVDKDNIIDYADFLQYLTGVCDGSSRDAERVAGAAEQLRNWALERQNKKLAKDGEIDTTAAWKLLRPVKGVVHVLQVDNVLRQMDVRLNATQLQRLQVLVAPSSNGEISRDIFHTFVNHFPKKISSMVYDLRKIVGQVPSDASSDAVFDRLNVETNGRLPLTKLLQEINAYAIEQKTGRAVDLRDFVYVVQWTGADCGGAGSVIIDRFLACVRENPERRNTKNEFVTHFDSPNFAEGVHLLRQEIKRCGKKPDGKFDFQIPFRLFDVNGSGDILLSEFENATRALGVEQFLSDQEVKSLMRRFDLTPAGGIDYEEFLRFILADSASLYSEAMGASTTDAAVRTILKGIVASEKLSSTTAVAFCNSLKRMFSILDKDTVGAVPKTVFVETLEEMGIRLSEEQVRELLGAFQSDDDEEEEGSVSIRYESFCDALLYEADTEDKGDVSHPQVLEMLQLLQGFHKHLKKVMRGLEEGVRIAHFFGSEKDKAIQLSVGEFKDALWKLGIRHPYLQDELSLLLSCFQSSDGFDPNLLEEFAIKGPICVLARGGSGLQSCAERLDEELGAFLKSDENAGTRLKALFDAHDGNGDGSLSKTDFVNVLQKAGCARFITPECEMLLLHILDPHEEGFITSNALNNLVDLVKVWAVKTSPGKHGNSPDHIKGDGGKEPQDNERDLESTEAKKAILQAIVNADVQLKAPFPFERYFEKYKHEESLVKSRIFEKTLDKFIKHVIQQHVVYDMKMMDWSVLVHEYEGEQKGFINYTRFLSDYQSFDRPKPSQQDAEVDCDDSEFWCPANYPGMTLKHSVLRIMKGVIHRSCPSEGQRTELRNEVERRKPALLSQHSINDWKLYELLVELGLQVHKAEADQLLQFLKNDVNHAEGFSCDKLLWILRECLPPPSPINEPDETKEEAVSPVKDTKLSTALGLKIHQCFILAAKRNVSGQHLLKQCDPDGTGLVTLLEFQTVLRLMGCLLTSNEADELKRILGDPASSKIDYTHFLRHLAKYKEKHQHHDGRKARPISPMPLPVRRPRHRPLTAPQVQGYGPNVQNVWTLSPKYNGHNTPACIRPTPPVLMDLREVDVTVLPAICNQVIEQCGELNSFLQSFALYDGKATGFVAHDAFYALMRKFGVELDPETMTLVLKRFAAITPDKFDYVEFTELASQYVARAMHGLQHSAAPTLTTKANVKKSLTVQQGNAPIHVRNDDQAQPPDSIKPLEGYPHPSFDTSTAVKPSVWSCPVCLHRQPQTVRACQICATVNPSSGRIQQRHQCSACGFRNTATAERCDLCQVRFTTDAGKQQAANQLRWNILPQGDERGLWRP